MTIYFVRHFKTLSNTQKRYIGRTDEPLFAPAQQVLPQGLPTVPDAIFTSPMLRCLQTKTLLYPNMPHAVIDGLREMDFGTFEGLTYEDLKENPHYRNFIDGIENAQDGEATATFKARCCEAFVKLLEACDALPHSVSLQSKPCTNKRQPCQPCKENTPQNTPARAKQAAPSPNIVIVCHGGTIMSILERFTPKSDTTRSFYDYQIGNGEVLACHWDGTILTPYSKG